MLKVKEEIFGVMWERIVTGDKTWIDHYEPE